MKTKKNSIHKPSRRPSAPAAARQETLLTLDSLILQDYQRLKNEENLRLKKNRDRVAKHRRKKCSDKKKNQKD